MTLSRLPAMWRDSDPRQIADSIALALIPMLDADFVYIAVPAGANAPPVEVAQIRDPARRDAVTVIKSMVRDAPKAPWEQAIIVANPLGEGTVSLAHTSIAGRLNGSIVAGSTQTGFPDEVQRLLLNIGGNEATIGMHRWGAEAEEKRFVTLIESSSDFIGVANLDGRPTFINPAGLDLIGLPRRDDISQRHILDFIAPQDIGLVRDECWPQVLQTGRWLGQICFRHFRTYELIPFMVDAFRVDDPRNQAPMNIATVSRDLRIQKQAEAELRLLNKSLEQRVVERTSELTSAHERLVIEVQHRDRTDIRLGELQAALSHAGRLSTAGQMAAAIAHELNQPLTAITSAANAARRLFNSDDVEDKGTLQDILEDVAGYSIRAGQILRRLRDFVRRGEIEKRNENVRGMVEDAVAFTAAGSGTLAVAVHLSFDPLAPAVFANRIQVQQVLVNLLNNAFEAMAASPDRVLQVTTKLIDRDMVEMVIADNGPGIVGEVADRLFKPFFSTKRDGMGLGLSLCRSIVDAHGGNLTYDARPTGGALFRFTLPAANNSGDNHADVA